MFVIPKIASPTFGSGLIIELHKPFTDTNTSTSTTTNTSILSSIYQSKSSSPQVYLYYVNATNDFDIYQLSLNESKIFAKQCSNKYCSLENFVESLKQLLPDDIEKECERGEKK